MPSTTDSRVTWLTRGKTDLRYGNGLLTTGFIPDPPNLDKCVWHAAPADGLFSAPARAALRPLHP